VQEAAGFRAWLDRSEKRVRRTARILPPRRQGLLADPRGAV